MKKIILVTLALVASLSAQEIYATFNIEADKSANLAFYSSGIIDKVYVDVASSVKKGDKLVELQNDDLKASLKIATASLSEAEVTLKFAKKDYDRQLLIKDLIDEAKFDQYELVYERSKVAVASAKANLAYQQSLLDRSIILAPFDGIIFEKSVEVGDVVSGMMLRTIFKIQSQSKRKLVFEFDQKYWKSVKVGDSVKYTVNGDKDSYTGKISKLYPHANSDNRKIKAEVVANGFIVGLFGEGYIIVPDEK
ncbi:efflux system, membrane fusion protein [Sulfurimonas gotlandica GD1]|jgi:RND family efflux transporter MFP subunit|uniref:Efflux system, membrane fusion protein n=1 Tax=Sulfurimonas gotlandica (strain DSM 19862 / JCM 16533 / GD1) TaxID=929558 RepID=B6BMX9_SULGG|nr:efflux RND transporter periplasmic adaptor subunit [Sulfurimonas gotlandica]EDZ61514.1 membrane fusion protein of the hefABC efflux system HefB [Sulfurimonas gotlandica GD1]EHP30748.1 efflux system, membrane fusion protein [Sulfurimonas gotlandica GD1]